MADAGQLQQVFLNIIINAETEMRLAHAKGELIIKTEQADNTIRISFKDDGPGITKENLLRIFEPFFTTRGAGQGTGLGLSVCHGIITEHGGRIYAESEPGEGATFFVELPILMPDKHVPPAGAVAKKEVRKTAKAHILVVDDEPMVREFLSEALVEEGYTVEAADNASDALGKLKTEKYGLVLLDIKLLGMNGIEFYERIQTEYPALANRVIIITGDVMGADTRDFLAKTKLPFITKSLDTESLKKGISHVLAQGARKKVGKANTGTASLPSH
jgi:CheY-like chemotaxis protein